MATLGIIGLKETNRAIRQLPEFAREEAQRTFDVTAFHFARMAAAKAPRKEGNLANDIAWESRPRSLSAVVTIRRNSYYWKMQEFGTVRHGAQPFLRPTAISLKPDHQYRLRKGLEKAANRVEREGEHGG